MKLGRRAAVLAAVILATPVFTASPMWAQGIGVNAHSGCNSGRFEAVIADPCADGSSVWYSPAALAFEPSVVTVGGTIIRNSSTFTFNADPGTVYKRGPSNPLAPHAWLNYRASDRLALGIGGWAPYGLTLVWPLDFPGRFGGYDNTVKAFYVQPTVAYQLVPKRLAIAAGADIVFGIMNIQMREDVATQLVPSTSVPVGTTFNNLGIPFGTDFANLQLKGNSTGFTGHFAALLKVSDQISLGARYLMGAKVKFNSGKATFTQVSTGRTLPVGNPLCPQGAACPLDALFQPLFASSGQLGNQTVKAEITYPAMAVVGVAVKPVKDLSLSADYQWTQWSKWDSVTLHLANQAAPQQIYLFNQNTTTIRVGANWVATQALQLRGGWGWNNAAEKDVAVSPLLPEAKRNYYALGAGYELTKQFRVDGFWQNVRQAARQGRLYPISAAQASAINRGIISGSDINVGLYTNSANLFGASLSYTFGRAR